MILFELNSNGNHEIINILNSFGYSNYYTQGHLELFSKFDSKSIYDKLVRLFLRFYLFKSRLKIFKIEKFRVIDYPIIIATHPNSKYHIKY